MKKILGVIYLMLPLVSVWACPVCDRNQPKLLRGLTHGQGPQNVMDYFLPALLVVLSLLALFFTLKWLWKPGERNDNHIKRFILNPENHEPEK